MKILFVARSLERGGAERYLTTLATGLRAAGHDVTIAVFYGGGAFEAEARDAGVDVVDLRKRSRWDIVGFGARLTKLERGLRPDVVYGILTIASMVSLPARWLVGAKVVWGVQNTGYDAVATDWLDRCHRSARGRRGPARRSGRRQLGLRSRRPRRAEGCRPSKVHVIPNGVDLARVPP